jgi:tRNA dimethylallyltransferase
LAKHYATKIISADSRQCFKELNIGVAKPSPEELAIVPHYFINSHSIGQVVNAAVFEQFALEKVNDIFKDSDISIMVGGTGLYVKTFCTGIDEVPVITSGIRENITADYQSKGLEWLQQEVEKNDPVYYSTGEIQNPRRLMRALEVKLSTGKSIVDLQTQKKVFRDFEIIKIGLELPKEELYQRVNLRVDMMIKDGLVEEVRNLETVQTLNALQTVGYRELFGYFRGEISLDKAIEAIKINTRHYAKRQLTWFKKDTEINWCKPDIEQVLVQIKNAGL